MDTEIAKKPLIRYTQKPWAHQDEAQRKTEFIAWERRSWWFDERCGKFIQVEEKWDHATRRSNGRHGNNKPPILSYEQVDKIHDVSWKNDCTLARALVAVLGEKAFSEDRMAEIRLAPPQKDVRLVGDVKKRSEEKKPRPEWKEGVKV